ncbi:sulfatase-like hydrolase/transferase [Rhodohalobacter sp. 614A]|uniref:sulfatase-like hydrolase/transferase n=1 Tax=Rhodohalobacter sp. 614A TaxID=2908649 RepID=UPI001F2D221C|nr:sulfatase-like hydrolase/transferase [Rhodohalobacter sp. 614A]
MHIRNGYRSSLTFVFLLLLIAGCSKEPEYERPNILWITSEDNSPFIGAYGDSLAVTPNIDRLADRGILFENAFATTPVCAPSRFTIITGTYGNSMGTEQMRSTYPVPDFVKFFPRYLREAGYYTTNNVKKDYNTVDQPEAWDESSNTAHYRNREEGQPFFHIRNFTTTHESQLHTPIDTLIHDPDQMLVPPYHPDTDSVRADWARYYDLITKLDSQVGEVLDELEASGEAENTIVFYYSDHGGVLPRSKRFMYESGLHIPMIIYLPPKYAHLGPEQDRTDRLVSFVDLAPTVLSLAGIEPPEWMDGEAFLGEFAAAEREYIHAYRGRMDERYDLVRAVRNKEYLYVHNYMPNRIYGQHLSYLWRSRTMKEWDELYQTGNLNEVQRRFFEEKPVEELYKISEDPHNINNLAFQEEYQEILMHMRNVNLNWMILQRDLGFIQESRIDSLRANRSLYSAVRDQNIPIAEIIVSAEIASLEGVTDRNHLSEFLNHDDSSVRYWAARRLIADKESAQDFYEKLLELAEDPSPGVRISAAEALYGLGETETAYNIINEALDHENFSVQLMALNFLEAIDISEFPPTLFEKISALYESSANDSFETDYYINRATGTLLD